VSPHADAGARGRALSDDGKTIVVAEGDSISVDYAGYYGGLFKVQHPTLDYRIFAVGGSGLANLWLRPRTR
jgi:hypothetical protein